MSQSEPAMVGRPGASIEKLSALGQKQTFLYVWLVSKKVTARNGWTPLRAVIASSRSSWLRGVTCLSGLALHIGCLQLDHGPTLELTACNDWPCQRRTRRCQ